MFTAIKDNKIIAISDTDSEFPCLVCDAIANDPEHTTSDYVEVDGEFVLVTDDKAIRKMKEDMRLIRNEYLTEYVDPKQLFLVWENLSVDDKGFYIDYRKYLLDYPESSKDWYKNAPLTPEEWKKTTERSIK